LSLAITTSAAWREKHARGALGILEISGAAPVPADHVRYDIEKHLDAVLA